MRSSPPDISREEAEHRLLRALKTSRVPGIVKSYALGAKSTWPVAQMVAGWGDYAPPITVPDFVPTRRDLGDWWLALKWFCALHPEIEPTKSRPFWVFSERQKLIAWRYYPY